MLPDNINASHFDSLLTIIKQNYEKASGEIYCMLHRKQKKSSQYAREALAEIVKSSMTLRKMVQQFRNSMPVKAKK